MLPVLWLVIELLFIFYITLYKRNFSLVQPTRLELFYSYRAWFDGSADSGRQILLNIALFVPLGFFLSRALRSWNVKLVKLWTLLISFGITAAIELIQYRDGLGTSELDDVFNNVLGAWLGACLFQVCERLDEAGRKHWFVKLVTALCLAAGLVGCQITGPVRPQTPYQQFMEYDFSVRRVVPERDRLTLEGSCRAYGREDMPPYQIVLKGEETGKFYKTDTQVDGSAFRAVVPAAPAEKCEVNIKFRFYSPVNTYSYINGNRTEDAGGAVPAPDTASTDLQVLVNYGVLKAYEPSCDAYVYQFRNELYWLVGSPLDKKTTVLFYLYTDEPEKLPEKWRKSRCDVQNFNVGGKNELTRTMRCGRYRVFARTLPAEYHVAAVRTGFYADKKTRWQKYFRVLQ